MFAVVQIIFGIFGIFGIPSYISIHKEFKKKSIQFKKIVTLELVICVGQTAYYLRERILNFVFFSYCAQLLLGRMTGFSKSKYGLFSLQVIH